MTNRSVSAKDQRILYGMSGAVCANCRCLIVETKSDGSKYHISEIAHIRGKAGKALRHDPILTDEETNDESNLIVLCPNCHTTIDKNEDDYPVERIMKIKKEHDEWVLSWAKGETNPDEIIRLMPSQRMTKTQFLSKADQLLQKTGWRVDLERRPVRPDGAHVFPHGMGKHKKNDLWAWKRIEIKPSMYLEYWIVLRFAGTIENILFYMERGIHYMANHLIRNDRMNLLVENCEKKSGLTADDFLIESKENQLFVRGLDQENELRPFVDEVTIDAKFLQEILFPNYWDEGADSSLVRIIPILIVDSDFEERYPTESGHNRRKAKAVIIQNRLETNPKHEAVHIVGATYFSWFQEEIETEMREFFRWLMSEQDVQEQEED